jgi:hypothetical protein
MSDMPKKESTWHPSLEIHIPISPTPSFLNMVRCLIHSLRRFGGAYRQAPVILTVGDEQIDKNLGKRHPWLQRNGIEVRWVPEPLFRELKYHATGGECLRYKFNADVVLLLDADILVAAPFDELIEEVYRDRVVAGVIAHQSPFQFFPKKLTWQDLYDRCGLGDAQLRHQYTGWPSMGSGDEFCRRCPPYFNYGVICAPSEIMSAIGQVVYPLWYKVNEAVQSDFNAQLALSLAITKLRVPYHCLPMRYNFANVPEIESLHTSELSQVRFVHLLAGHAKCPVHKAKLFADFREVQAFIQRSDLSFVNEVARKVLAAICPGILEEDHSAA